LYSPSSVVYFLWLATALSPFFDPSLVRARAAPSSIHDGFVAH
jgi:hypothetical protein